MAFVCPKTNEVALNFAQLGSDTKVATAQNSVACVTFTDAMSETTGQLEHWKWVKEEELTEEQKTAVRALSENKDLQMIRAEGEPASPVPVASPKRP